MAKQQDGQADADLDVSSSKGLLRSTGLVSFFTLLSRVLGLARDIVLLYFFPASKESGLDAFFVAFKIPNFFRRLFAEGAFAQAFVPVLSEYKSKRGYDAVRDLVDHVAGMLGVWLFVATGLAMVGAPFVVAVFAPGFVDTPVKYQLSADMLRITFPYLLFISLTALCGAILNSYNRFVVPAFTPVLLNICLIVAAVGFHETLDQPLMALAWGVFVAGLVQLGFQIPFLMQLRLLPRPKFDPQHEGVKRIFTLMLPVLFGVSVSQINLLLDTVLASFLETGSVTWLYTSDRLMGLPLGIIATAVGTVILPKLSQQHASASKEAFANTMDWSVRVMVLVGLPASLALLVLAEPIISTLFYHGEFAVRDVLMSAKSLKAYSLGILAFMLIKVLAPGYFSRQDTKTPVKIGIQAMAVNMVLNIALVFSLAHVGLALATAIAAYVNAVLLYVGLQRRGIYQLQAGWQWLWGRLLIAALLMITVLLQLQGSTEMWLQWDSWERIWRLTGLCLTGLLVYGVSVFCLGLRPRHFKH